MVFVSLRSLRSDAVGGSRQAPERPAVGKDRPFQLGPRIERTLPNGLRVIVTQQNVVPKVTLMLTVLSGYSSDPANMTGLANLTADAVQEGTKAKNSRQIRAEIFGMGGSLSSGVSQDYSQLVVRGLSEFTPQLLGVLADVAMNPTLPADEIAILKQQRLQGVMQQKASPQFVANREFRKALFGDHPYARTSETEATLQAIDRAAIDNFHRSHYRPNNAFLLIVGAVDPNATFATVEKAFGGWTRGDVPKPVFAAAPPLTGRRVVFVQRPNSIQSSIAVGNFAVKRSDPRWFELSVANTIYGGAFNSRIVRNIREEKGYTYSPSSILTGFADAGFYRFAADVRNEVTGATLTEVFKEIDKLRAEGSAGDELGGAKSLHPRHLPDSDGDAERARGDAEQRLRLRSAERLSRNVQRQDRGDLAGAGEERRGDAAGIREHRDHHRRRLGEGQGSARGVQGHHVPRHRRQEDRGAAVTANV